MRALLIALAILNFSGSSFASGTDFDVIQSEAFSLYPSVSTDLTFESQRSQLGWGSFDLTAVPEVDEIRVDLVIGVPAAEVAWRTCKRLELVSAQSRCGVWPPMRRPSRMSAESRCVSTTRRGKGCDISSRPSIRRR